jgi:superoxide reductase
MENLSQHVKQADWKQEKHVPVIEAPDSVKADEIFQVKVTLGKEVAHPNTTEHHIRWISLYYHDEGGKFPHEVAHVEFGAHGESAEGPNQGPVYTHHEAITNVKIAKSGVLHAVAYCNIHGLWESSTAISVG